MRLDFEVEGGLSGEGRTQVYLHEPGFQVRINQNIIAEQFKAVLATAQFFELGLDLGVDAKERLEDDVVDAGPEQIHVDAHLFEVFRQSPQTPLVPAVVHICVHVVDVLIVFLVDREVGQVRKFGALPSRRVILLRRKPTKPLVVNVNAPRVHRSDRHIHTQVKLEPVNEERFRYVATNDAILVNWNLGNVVNLKNLKRVR